MLSRVCHHMSICLLHRLTLLSDPIETSRLVSSFKGYRGLTAPTQAGLALSLLLCAAMVAASPAVDTTFLPSDWDLISSLTEISSLNERGLPAAWLADLSQDAFPIFNSKVNLLLSELSPPVDEILDLVHTATLRSTEWHGDLIAHVSSYMQNWETASAEVQTVAAQVSDEISRTGSALVDNAIAQVFHLHDTISHAAMNLQRSVDSNLQEMQTVVLARMQQASAHLHNSLDDFKDAADESMIRQAGVLKGEAMILQNQAEILMEKEMSNVRQLFVDPVIAANNAFWDSFNLEIAREAAIAKQAKFEMKSQFESAWNLKSAELQNVLFPGVTRGIDAFCTSAKAGLQADLVTLEAKFATTADDIRNTVLPNARQEFEMSFDNVLGSAGMGLQTLQETIRSMTSSSQAHAISNLERWRATTDAQIAEDRNALVHICDSLTREVTTVAQSTGDQAEIVRDHIMSVIDKSKGDFEHFKNSMDRAMLEEGAVLKARFLALYTQSKSFLDYELDHVEQHVVTPMVGVHRGILDSVNSEIDRQSAIVTDAALELQNTWDSKYTEFQTNIFPELSRNTAMIYSKTKGTISGEPLGLHSDLRSTTNGIQGTDIPRVKEIIESFSESTNKVAETVKDATLSTETLPSQYDRLQDQLFRSQ